MTEAFILWGSKFSKYLEFYLFIYLFIAGISFCSDVLILFFYICMSLFFDFFQDFFVWNCLKWKATDFLRFYNFYAWMIFEFNKCFKDWNINFICTNFRGFFGIYLHVRNYYYKVCVESVSYIKAIWNCFFYFF